MSLVPHGKGSSVLADTLIEVCKTSLYGDSVTRSSSLNDDRLFNSVCMSDGIEAEANSNDNNNLDDDSEAGKISADKMPAEWRFMSIGGGVWRVLLPKGRIN